MIEKKELTDKEIQILIDRELEKRKWDALVLNAEVQQKIFQVFYEALKDAKMVDET